MSLSQSVLEIARDLEVESWEVEDPAHLKILIKSTIKQLRRVVNAVTPDNPTPPTPCFIGKPPDPNDPETQEIYRIQQEVMARMGERARIQERVSEVMREVIGGPADDSLFPVPSNITAGLSTVIAGAYYTLHDDFKLYYDEEKTKKAHEELKGKQSDR